MSLALGLANRAFRPATDVPQVLQRNPFVAVFRFMNEVFADAVIGIAAESRFSSRQLLDFDCAGRPGVLGADWLEHSRAIAPEGTVGTVGSIMNFFSNVLGIAAPIVTGFIAGSTGSFAIGFIVAAVVLVVGIRCYVFLLGNIEQIPMPPEQIESVDTSRAPGAGAGTAAVL